MNHQYAVAVYVLSLLYHRPESSSDDLAADVGVHPVGIRTVMGQLRRAELIETRRGVPGAQLTRHIRDITLHDVYKAVNAPGQVLKHQPATQPVSEMGLQIQAVLDASSERVQASLEAVLKSYTLADVLKDLPA